jgi:hypothetical protein
MTTDTTAQRSADEADRSYRLDLDVIEAQGRSVQLFLADRLCDGAVARLKGSNGWTGMSVKDLRKLLRDGCDGQDGYVSPQHPLLEAALRLLLVAPKDTLTLSAIHDAISEAWLYGPWPRHVSREALGRVLDNAAAEGIVRA